MLLGGTANATATITGNNASSTSSVSIDGTALDASAPTDETATITFSSSTAPANSATVTIGSITYTFSTSNITSAPATGCTVYSATGSTGATSLYQAISYTGTQGNTNYRCASSITAANSAVTASHTGGSSTISLTASTAGSTGFTFGETGTTNFTTFSNTAGTNGTQDGSTWTYWSGAAAVSAAQVAANIASTINSNGTLGALVYAVTGTNSSGQATITVYAEASGTTGDYTTAVANFSDHTWSGNLTGSSTDPMDSRWFPLTYFYSTTQGECDNNAPSADYVGFNTGIAGSANQPTIIAYDNLYSGCPTTSVPVPNIYWQYNTGTGYTVTTSPVVSLDGTQVAFVQDNGTQAQLVILKWARNSALMTLSSTSSYASSTGGCTAPCMVAINFADDSTGQTTRDTTSSPFYDYANDIIYVGDSGTSTTPNEGYLHKFTNIFNTAKGNTQPAEVVETGTDVWPALISASNPVASPVLDSVTGQVMIGPTGYSGCSSSDNCGENFHEVSITIGSGTNGVTTDTNHFNNAANTGQTDTPILDPVAAYAYTFTPDDTGGHAAVWQYHVDNTTDFENSDTEVTIGQGATGSNQFSGSFDNLYFTGATTGHLYVCGRATGSQDSTIWQIPITTATSAMGTAVAGPALTSNTANCSAVSEYDNGSKDYIFLSVTDYAVDSTGVVPCTGGGGCLISFDVTAGSAFTSTTAANSVNAVLGGTGGLVIDNAFSSPTGEGNVYYFPLASGTCAGSSPSPALGVGTGVCGFQVEQSNVAQ